MNSLELCYWENDWLGERASLSHDPVPQLMQRITKLFLLVTALFAASALFARAGGAGFEHPAYQGLVPPWSGFSNDASTVSAETSAGLSRQPGLRLPYRGHGRGDDAFEIVGWSAGGFSLYSGTRMMQRLGSEY